MAQFPNFNQTIGAGPRGNPCVICMCDFETEEPTIRHEDGRCLATFCHECFDLLADSGISPLRCPNCRVPMNPSTHTGNVDVGGPDFPDGLNIYWPTLTGTGPQSALEAERLNALTEFNVPLDEYNHNFFLHRATIAGSVEDFLEATQLSIINPEYVGAARRDAFTASPEFVAWLYADRQVCRQTGRLNLNRWVARSGAFGQRFLNGVMGHGWPEGVTKWHRFIYDDAYWLVPFILDQDEQFWAVGEVVTNRGWRMQHEYPDLRLEVVEGVQVHNWTIGFDRHDHNGHEERRVRLGDPAVFAADLAAATHDILFVTDGGASIEHSRYQA